VERISAAKPTNRRFEVDFEKFSESAFNVIWGEPQEVTIRFSPEQAPYIQERTWHPSQKLEKCADGSIELTMNVANLWEVKRCLIGYGADAQVLRPMDLAEDIEDSGKESGRLS
jgi:predicted DNA-binding transcriptional regulator YafY